MSTSTVIELSQQAMLLVLVLSLPAAVTAMLVGLAVGVLQSVTQVQDQSIGYAAKLVAVSLALVVTGRWFGTELHRFADILFLAMAAVGR